MLESEHVLDNYKNIKEVADTLFLSMNQPCVTDIRNYGLTWCIDIKTGTLTDEDISKLFLDNGLYLGVWNSPTHTGQLLIHVPSVFDHQYYVELRIRLRQVLEQLSGQL